MSDAWPALPYDEVAPTGEYLHRIAQIGGKYTLFAPFHPNWGGIALPLGPRGFATPTLRAAGVTFAIRYELLDDRVVLESEHGVAHVPLRPGSVAAFYADFAAAARTLGIPALPNTLEPEIAGAPHFDTDLAVRAYDPDAARRIWAAFTSVSHALEAWQAAYTGYRTPIGIMWGGFDLYAPRYAGKPKTPPLGKPTFLRNGETDDVVAVGFSLGDATSRSPAVYAYAVPAPADFATADFGGCGAHFVADAGLAVLPWERVRASDDPHGTIVRFADAVFTVVARATPWPAEIERRDGWHAARFLVPPTVR